jgi:hypothetical protein
MTNQRLIYPRVMPDEIKIHVARGMPKFDEEFYRNLISDNPKTKTLSFTRQEKVYSFIDMVFNPLTERYESLFELKQREKLRTNLENIAMLKKDAKHNALGALCLFSTSGYLINRGLDRYSNGDVLGGTVILGLSFGGFVMGNKWFSRTINYLKRIVAKQEENQRIRGE